MSFCNLLLLWMLSIIFIDSNPNIQTCPEGCNNDKPSSIQCRYSRERSISDQWFSTQRDSNAKFWCFLVVIINPGQAFEQTIEWPVNWDNQMLTWCNVTVTYEWNFNFMNSSWTLTHWPLEDLTNNFGSKIFKLIPQNSSLGACCEIAPRWLPQNLSNEKSTLVQVMAWCRQATSHYQNQCWPRSLTSYGITRPQWVKGATYLRYVYSSLLQWPLFNRSPVGRSHTLTLTWSNDQLYNCSPSQLVSTAMAYREGLDQVNEHSLRERI